LTALLLWIIDRQGMPRGAWRSDWCLLRYIALITY
jgi:hypothetical protein